METSGLLSVLFAIGTVVGILSFFYGMWRRSRWTKIGGFAVFVFCFGSLFYLLATHGAHLEANDLQKARERFQVASWRLTSPQGEQTDLLRTWQPPVNIGVLDSSLILRDPTGKQIDRLLEVRDSVWRITGAPVAYAPLTGDYLATYSANGELILTKVSPEGKELMWLVPSQSRKQQP